MHATVGVDVKDVAEKLSPRDKPILELARTTRGDWTAFVVDNTAEDLVVGVLETQRSSVIGSSCNDEVIKVFLSFGDIES